MKRPDQTFTITVNPVSRLIGCDEKRSEESSGLFGFHNWEKCPKCQTIPEGYEFWGENGHKQGGCSSTDKKELAVRLRYLARNQWRKRSGELMGYRFRSGSRIYYRGN